LNRANAIVQYACHQIGDKAALKTVSDFLDEAKSAMTADSKSLEYKCLAAALEHHFSGYCGNKVADTRRAVYAANIPGANGKLTEDCRHWEIKHSCWVLDKELRLAEFLSDAHRNEFLEALDKIKGLRNEAYHPDSEKMHRMDFDQVFQAITRCMLLLDCAYRLQFISCTYFVDGQYRWIIRGS
jgi:hypothetical protein